MTVTSARPVLAAALILSSFGAGVAAPELGAQTVRVPDPAVKEGVDAWGRGDYAGAVAKWRKPAIDGDPDAQFNLGQAYKMGRGVPADMKAAEDWYRRAALQGHYQGGDNYGLMLFQNNRRAEAMPWLEKSVARGEPRAQYYLGAALFNGDGVTKDWVRAYALMTRASAAGLAPASRSLAQMDKYIPLAQRQQGMAMARDMESTAARPVLAGTPSPLPATTGPRTGPRPVDLPPSQPVRTVQAPPPRAIPTPKPAPRPAPPRPDPAPAAPASGAWRVQLGAFGDAAKARGLWGQISPRVSGLSGLQPFLVKAGAVTRLQAGPVASKAAADRLCAAVIAAGNPCITAKP